ncbi:hypothetical protein PDIG_87100 [Penicillium digitatum PHI26]|uniref:Uncharacterized protein n=2 Tax=Penicillium digitatum TaxID=36651 RepID=K9F771_PEND2|nr:hypothetical protein PDIP_33100 [Penicillium digitatum Pd1]EKV04909.1 hypothetical protein PDIG_87100 [Penicillium digitatum PHI26]EKV17111.1 hypothetical protein PDIP_33100 [Penicillium digitatum Pd1]
MDKDWASLSVGIEEPSAPTTGKWTQFSDLPVATMFDDHTSPTLLRTQYSADPGERARNTEIMRKWVDPWDAEKWWQFSTMGISFTLAQSGSECTRFFLKSRAHFNPTSMID